MRKASIIGIVAGLLGGLHGGQAMAQADTKALVERGRQSYLFYCFQCHGEDGKGTGPMAGLLKVTPADLTRIRRAEHKEFPFEQVYSAIEGRMDTRGHGERKMPLWGPAFAGDRAIMINELVFYIETLQLVK